MHRLILKTLPVLLLAASIATVHAPLGRHLRATIRTGLQCSYQPDPDDERDWILDQRPQPPK